MYPEDLVAPMREELTSIGMMETRSPQDVEDNIKREGTTLLVINSVCGCSATSARPAVKLAMENKKVPDCMITAFAGNDREAVAKARSLMSPFPPSSPCIGLFKNGELVHMVERHHIEGRQAEMIAENLTQAFDEYC